MFEREIFEFPPDSRHSEPVRQRSVEISSLLRDAFLPVDAAPVAEVKAADKR